MGKIAFYEGASLASEHVIAGLDGVFVGRVNIDASDHEVDGAAERVGYLPGGGQRDAAEEQQAVRKARTCG